MSPNCKQSALILSLFCLLSCGGGSGTSSPSPVAATTVAAPPPPTDAVITLSGVYECLTSFCDYANFIFEAKNSGGVRANLNYIRASNQQGSAVWELGSDHIVNASGTNVVPAGSSMFFVITSGQLTFYYSVGYRDANGNKGEAHWFPELPR